METFDNKLYFNNAGESGKYELTKEKTFEEISDSNQRNQLSENNQNSQQLIDFLNAEKNLNDSEFTNKKISNDFSEDDKSNRENREQLLINLTYENDDVIEKTNSDILKTELFDTKFNKETNSPITPLIDSCLKKTSSGGSIGENTEKSSINNISFGTEPTDAFKHRDNFFEEEAGKSKLVQLEEFIDIKEPSADVCNSDKNYNAFTLGDSPESDIFFLNAEKLKQDVKHFSQFEQGTQSNNNLLFDSIESDSSNLRNNVVPVNTIEKNYPDIITEEFAFSSKNEEFNVESNTSVKQDFKIESNPNLIFEPSFHEKGVHNLIDNLSSKNSKYEEPDVAAFERNPNLIFEPGFHEKCVDNLISNSASQNSKDEEPVHEEPLPVFEKSSEIGPKELFSKYGLDTWFNPERLNPTVEAFIYWRDPKLSGIIFGSGLVLLLSMAYFSLISVIANTGLGILTCAIVFRLYKDVLQAVQKTPQSHPYSVFLNQDIALPQEKVHELVDTITVHVNACLSELRRLFLVEDLIESAKFALVLWALTYLGSWFNGLTLVIIGFVSLFTLPKVYENNKSQIDQNLVLVRVKLEELTSKIKDALPAPLRRKLPEKKE